MGFLSGSYLKIMSAKMRIQLQSQLTSVTMQMTRITKQIGSMEKRLNSEQRHAEVAMRNQMSSSVFGYAKEFGIDPTQPTGLMSENVNNAALQKFSIFQQSQQARMAQAQTVWGDYFEEYREAQLEPLKNIETNLSTEKANLETRLKLVEGQEEASKQMEKSSQKDFVPEYTGGQG